MVVALCYTPEGRGFESQRGHLSFELTFPHKSCTAPHHWTCFRVHTGPSMADGFDPPSLYQCITVVQTPAGGHADVNARPVKRSFDTSVTKLPLQHNAIAVAVSGRPQDKPELSIYGHKPCIGDKPRAVLGERVTQVLWLTGPAKAPI
jgi:hypothetical protein